MKPKEAEEVLNARPSMVRYHDLKVVLYRNAFAENKTNPFTYVDPFEHTGVAGKEYPVTVEKITYSSDTSPTVLQGTIADINIVKRNYVDFNTKQMPDGDWSSQNDDSSSAEKFVPIGTNPTVGWGISVSVIEDKRNIAAKSMSAEGQSADLERIIFKGYISSISRQIGQNGIFYRFEARDIKSRLTYQTIKKVYNASYKIAGFPIFNEKKITSTDEFDNPYIEGNLTIGRILEDILSYAEKTSSNGTNNTTYSSFVGFTITDFIFGDDYLKNFVPPTISFDNVTILEAIYKLINTAGPYRMVVDYKLGTSDKIYFSSLNNKCKNCGEKVELKYGNGINGFNDVNVISDTTYRKIYDACNIMKSYTGAIEWYSGHFHIEKGNIDTRIKSLATFASIDNDGKVKSYTKNVLSCRNWDGYHYYFGLNSRPLGQEESNSNTYVVVGTPLYPATDPNIGYGPYVRNFLTFLDDPETPVKDMPANKQKVCLTLNSGVTENDMKFIKHRNFLDTVGRDRFKSAVGVSYVAYAPYDICWACNGTGAVEQDCSGGKYAWIFGNTRGRDGTRITKIKIGETIKNIPSFSPFKYNFVRAHYEVDGKEGMQPYVGDGYLVPSNHPLPWKNTCPVCRGTGIEPWFKMGTILNSLVDISPSQVKIGEITSDKVGNQDPNDGSLVLDKTYAQIAEDMSYKYPVTVHVETATGYLAYAQDAESNSNTWIKHPLADTKQIVFCEYEERPGTRPIERPNMNAKIFPDGNDGSTRAADNDSKYVQALFYTQIQDAKGYQIDTDRSMVIFSETMFIPCRNPMATVTEEITGNKIKAPAYDKSLKCFRYSYKGEMNGVGQNVGSFWRPSRAWITCYFKRDRYEHFFKDEQVVKRTQIGVGETTDVDLYKVAPRIEDNRYCAEIRKTSSEDGSSIEEFNIRPVAKGIFCDSFKWQVHPWDFEKMPNPAGDGDDGQDFIVPTDYKDTWGKNGPYKYNIKKGFCFPCGKLLKFEKLREIEVRKMANAGKNIEDVLESDVKGKIIAWTHKDERMKLFEKACAELERRNNIQISGTITVRGEIPCFTGGFGWVELYDKMTACIVKIELTFGNNFIMNLEVGTEEMRVGQKKESEKEYDRLIRDAVSDLNITGGSRGIDGAIGDGNDSSGNATYLGSITAGGSVYV